MKEKGYRSVLIFVILHSGISSVKPAKHIDPKYAQLYQLAKSNRV